MIPSLYLHIPFCDSLCHYCDFGKVLTGTFSQEKYIDSLLIELDSLAIPDDSLKTIYIGGGTPSALKPELLTRLLSRLHSSFSSVTEFTIECNPESLSEEKVKIMSQFGVNRVSLGVQTFQSSLLSSLNRKHSKEQVFQSVSLLKKHGITNINLDFIYGIHGQTLSMIKEDIDTALFLKPTHLSFYSLQVEEGTVLYIKGYPSVSNETYREQYDFISKRLHENGFFRYEVSNFSLPGSESKHNLNYWNDGMYYACGLSASGYLPSLRYQNTRSMNHYLQHKFRYQEEPIDIYDEEFEFLMLNLRKADGFTLDEFSSRFKKDFITSYQKEIEDCSPSLIIKDGRAFIKEEDLYVMDQILLKLLILPEDLRMRQK